MPMAMPPCPPIPRRADTPNPSTPTARLKCPTATQSPLPVGINTAHASSAQLSTAAIPTTPDSPARHTHAHSTDEEHLLLVDLVPAKRSRACSVIALLCARQASRRNVRHAGLLRREAEGGRRCCCRRGHDGAPALRAPEGEGVPGRAGEAPQPPRQDPATAALRLAGRGSSRRPETGCSQCWSTGVSIHE